MERQLHTTHNKTETEHLGKEFASRLVPGDIIALYGDLGAGKTEFVRGVCDYFRVGEIVSSPTFTIINSYIGVLPNEEEVRIYHLDLYRINSTRELEEIGFEECMAADDAIKLIEWADKAQTAIPAARYSIIFHLDDKEEDTRHIEIRRTEQHEVVEPIIISS
ncbi:MAG: tRNA (adenosine(37)-N6)-threonylcarbamoyltransferase complex ATPase subunit type 1 TsaE [Bacteroidota bacterium]|nr:tRNA (adenosine(37)-N6)-threonylcarbamoyltransferase complex ATPase subunit type 1 TsaE [Candidatus Kapabacteria bacterium]MDW8221091.1 tRNA (adenosine(37)-N6)-threonylcarbamoyltransferase complex ATPase subunit type 1 TsaE [Bacteroidota bacterium]